MSGTFKDLTVPPTLVAFAVDVVNVNQVISSEFKECGSNVILVKLQRDANGFPDFSQLDKNYTEIHELIKNKKVLSAHTIRTGGLAEAISKMCFGNKIGFSFNEKIELMIYLLRIMAPFFLKYPGILM